MSSQHPIIKLGLDLLRTGSINPVDLTAYRDVFSLLQVNISIPIRLSALQSVFYEEKNAVQINQEKPKWYLPSELDSKHICLPELDEKPDVSFFKPPEVQSDIDDLVFLERWGTFVATTANPSTPLFDLFKIAAALHDCIATGETERQCLLVGCDFSGIQDTVYTITSKGALKTLRARSFMLELLCEHIIHEILEIANSDRHAVVYSGGGGFGLVLPNSDMTVKKIKEFRTQLNNWALDEFSGRLFIAIDVNPFKAEKLKNDFQEIRQTQSDNLDRLKRLKFIDQLDQLVTQNPPLQLTVATECQITRRDDLPAERMFDLNEPEKATCMSDKAVENIEDGKWTWVSESCLNQYKLGDDLVGAEKIFRYSGSIDPSKANPHGVIVFPGTENKKVFYSVTTLDVCETPDEEWTINSWNGGKCFLYANYVRKHQNLSCYAQQKENESLAEEKRKAKPAHTATFQGLASSSCGADLIGALRMDVDNLGNMFNSIISMTILSARSRMMNLFFKVYLNKICNSRQTDILEKDKAKNNEWGNTGRNVSVVYSGGDDLFIVGAWDDTVELAVDIQQKFESFTSGRPLIEGGISGGLTLHQPKYPLYQMAESSAEAEKYAKHDKDSSIETPEKNRIALFFDESKHQWHRELSLNERQYRYMLSMTWPMVKDFLIPLMITFKNCYRLKYSENSRNFIEIDKFSYSTIEKWFSVLDKYQERHLLYLPTMARVMRGIEREFKNDTELFEKLVGFLYTRDSGKENWISHLHIALNWLAYMRRNR